MKSSEKGSFGKYSDAIRLGEKRCFVMVKRCEGNERDRRVSNISKERETFLFPEKINI